MKTWLVVALMATVAMAGCTEDAGTDSDGAQNVMADADSTDPDALKAFLEASTVEGNATLPVTLTFDVQTDMDDVEWELTMTPESGGTVLRMGQGGLEDLPGTRSINLTEGTYTATFLATAGDDSSEASLTIVVHPDPDDIAKEAACKEADYFFHGSANGEGVYLVGDDEVWQETNGKEGLQTPDSCPDGPHDTRLV